MAAQTGSTRTHDEFNKGMKEMHKEASNVMDKAKDIASSAADRAKGVASAVGQKAEQATHAMGSGMESVANTIREHVPDGGIVGTAGSKLASGLEATGHYLREEGLQGAFEDATNLIRRNPLPAMLVGVAVGFLLARLTSSRS